MSGTGGSKPLAVYKAKEKGPTWIRLALRYRFSDRGNQELLNHGPFSRPWACAGPSSASSPHTF